ncbi:Ropporin-1-like protein [Lobulomyces angularis]|nr:Ropporin-1-like protein [Lobulomyces angularis]
MTQVASRAKPAPFGAPETMYCAEQIRIPPDLPEILKNYTKYVIKNQPSDIITASAEYFGRLAKQRIKAFNSTKRVTNQQLEAIYKKLTNPDLNFPQSKKSLESICTDVPYAQIADIVTLGGWSDEVPWLKFWALLVAAAAGTIHSTVEVVCEILGDNGSISATPFLEIFQFLTERDPEIPKSASQKILQNLKKNLNNEKLEINFLVEMIKKEIPIKFDYVSPVNSRPSTENKKNNVVIFKQSEVQLETPVVIENAEEVEEKTVSPRQSVPGSRQSIVPESKPESRENKIESRESTREISEFDVKPPSASKPESGSKPQSSASPRESKVSTSHESNTEQRSSKYEERVENSESQGGDKPLTRESTVTTDSKVEGFRVPSVKQLSSKDLDEANKESTETEVVNNNDVNADPPKDDQTEKVPEVENAAIVEQATDSETPYPPTEQPTEPVAVNDEHLEEVTKQED